MSPLSTLFAALEHRTSLAIDRETTTLQRLHGIMVVVMALATLLSIAAVVVVFRTGSKES